MQRKLISIVSSCYNEDGNLWELYDRTTAVMSQFPQYNFEYILADNGSSDHTQDTLRAIAQKDKRFKIIVNTRNFGGIRSSHNAWQAASGDCVIIIPSDLQDPPELIASFIIEWEKGYKFVAGVKNKSKENPIMYWVRKQYYKLIKAISDTEMIENFTGFGLYDCEVCKYLLERDWPVPYTRAYVNELGFERAIVYYTQQQRKYGKTSYSFLKLYDVAMDVITSFSKVPLRIATIFGSILAGLSLMAALFYLILKLLFWESMPMGTAPLVIGLFFFSAIQIVFIGLVGEYVMRILTYLDKKPLVIEKERINFDNSEDTTKN